MEQQIKFLVEEFHRGEWNPLMTKDKNGNKVQRRVIITQEEANRMNHYKGEWKLRYVKAEKTPLKEVEVVDEVVVKADDKTSLQAKYQEKFGKKPFHGWSEEQLTEKLNA